MRVWFLIFLLSFIVTGQKKYIVSNKTATIHWVHEVPEEDSVKFLIYTKTELFEPWLLIGETTEKSFTIEKKNYKMVAFGVQAISKEDTSVIHSSLDGDACVDPINDSCFNKGPWYIDWKVTKPTEMYLEQ